MNSFKVGDRVAIYDNQRRYVGTLHSISQEYKDCWNIVVGGYRSYGYHYKQLRKLKPRKKRMKLWLREYLGSCQREFASEWYSTFELAQGRPEADRFWEVVEFIEVKK